MVGLSCGGGGYVRAACADRARERAGISANQVGHTSIHVQCWCETLVTVGELPVFSSDDTQVVVHDAVGK